MNKIIFPLSLEYIGGNALAFTNLTSINIGPNVNSFDGYSVNQAPNLNYLIVDENNDKFSSENYFIFNKNKDTIIRAPIDYKVDDIPNKNNIKELGFCFMSGSRIEKFIGWESLEKVGEISFHACANLKIVDLSMTKVSEIPPHCFWFCNSLSQLYLPKNLTTISQFDTLPKLKTLVIPSTVYNITDNTFKNIPKLKVIAYFGTTSFSGRSLFVDCPSNIIVRVTKLYPSNLFSTFNVVYDAYEFGV